MVQSFNKEQEQTSDIKVSSLPLCFLLFLRCSPLLPPHLHQPDSLQTFPLTPLPHIRSPTILWDGERQTGPHSLWKSRQGCCCLRKAWPRRSSS